MRIRAMARLAALSAALFSALGALAGGPLDVCTSTHTPMRYSSPTVTLNYDMGALGTHTKAQADALVTNAVSLWTNVGTATVNLARGVDLPVDVTTANYGTYFYSNALGNIGVFSDAYNPVVYDTDGTIIDLIYGAGASNSILGVAGSASSGCNYAQGQAVINGRFSDDTLITTVMAHEIGHLIGMDHTQLDSAQGLSPAFPSNYPLMYPIAYRDFISLHEDDAAAVSYIYPDATLNSTYGHLQGTFVTAGGTPIRGANIWAQGTGGTFSRVSDYLQQNTGAFELLLPPGTYTLHAEAIHSNFTSGSSVGPYSESPADPSSYSFQPPLYTPVSLQNGGSPMAPVTLGGGTPTTITITAGCVGNQTFRIDGTGSLTGNCTGASPPAAPTTTSPTGTITTTTPTYSWSAVSGATSYDLLVQTPAGADVFLVNYTISAAGCSSGTGSCTAAPANALSNGVSYYWFVRARNAAGASGWSAFRAITVNTSTGPAAPVPSQPNGAIATLTPMFLWTPSPGATSYDLLVTGTGGFSLNLTLSQAGCPTNVGACGYTPSSPLTAGTSYTWQVRGNNASGSGPYSSPMSFSTPVSTAPAVPVPSQPNGTITNTTPMYFWTPSPGATSYTVQLNGPGGFTTALSLAQSGCPSNLGACGYVQPVPLAASGYTWQVRANNAGGSSAFSAPMAFTVAGVSVPAPPVLGQPNGAISTLTPMYLWTPSPGATGYMLQVSTLGGLVVINQALTLSQAGCPANVGACGLTPATALTAGTAYTWTVSASNSGGSSAFSAPRAFNTAGGGSPPPVPVPGSPNGGTVTLASPAELPFLLWTPAPGATAYTVLLQAVDGMPLLTQTYSLAAASCPTNVGACGVMYPYGYVSGTGYQWSVRSENSFGASIYSTARPFTIVYTSSPASAPATPAPGAPSGAGSTLTPMYLWTPSVNATSYTVQVQRGSTLVFSTQLTLAQASCPTNAGACGYVGPSLSAGTSYTWSVAASNSAGASAFSAPRAFSTN
jgi:hypothetical protein